MAVSGLVLLPWAWESCVPFYSRAFYRIANLNLKVPVGADDDEW